MYLYPNLFFIIAEKIHEKHHLYLRLVSPKWKTLSEKIISYVYVPFRHSGIDIEMIFANQKLFHIKNFMLKPHKNALSYAFDIICDYDNKILFYLLLKKCVLQSRFGWGGITRQLLNQYIFNLDILKYILHKGNFDEDEFDNRGRIWNDILYYFCKKKQLEIIKLLIDKGVNINTRYIDNFSIDIRKYVYECFLNRSIREKN